MTTTEVVAGFCTTQAAAGWLSDRYRDTRGRPLTAPAGEHLPRVALEEQILAWLLRHPGEARGVMAELPRAPWTADCRHEIYAALRTAAGNAPQAGYEEISAELRRRLLRAPQPPHGVPGRRLRLSRGLLTGLEHHVSLTARLGAHPFRAGHGLEPVRERDLDLPFPQHPLGVPPSLGLLRPPQRCRPGR